MHLFFGSSDDIRIIANALDSYYYVILDSEDCRFKSDIDSVKSLADVFKSVSEKYINKR